MMTPIWIIILIPFLGFITNFFFGKFVPKKLSSWFATCLIFTSFILCASQFYNLAISSVHSQPNQILFNWITFNHLSIDISFTLDRLSALMIIIITGIGFLIHLYSIGYMQDDEKSAHFFAYMNLFIFFMLILVLADSLLLIFIGWEGVGLCSYLLIGFYQKKNSAALAAFKAFIYNRVGDVAFIIAILLCVFYFGTLDIIDIQKALQGDVINNGKQQFIDIFTLCIFIAATAKSAQLPLYSWLVDAMEGPTPISALIHAATMVTAGIYIIAKFYFAFILSGFTLSIILTVGTLTALYGSFLAVTQTDIKKVLAFSTVSQLGYMFMALGVGAFSVAVFHLMTHAFFKSLLFLCSGSIITAMHHEQDMRKMGGLYKKIPITYICCLIGAIAISGLPFASGFFSKDEILWHVLRFNNYSWIFWVLGITGSFFTSLYIFRMLFMTFHGKQKFDKNLIVKESPRTMTIPLIILSFASIFGGALSLNHLFDFFSIGNLLNIYFNEYFTSIEVKTIMGNQEEIISIFISILIAFLALSIAKRFYLPIRTERIENVIKKYPFLYNFSYNRGYFDSMVRFMIIKPILKIGIKFGEFTIEMLLKEFIAVIARIPIFCGNILQKSQSGKLQHYILIFILGLSIILFAF